jgi:hypothetical protein
VGGRDQAIKAGTGQGARMIEDRDRRGRAGTAPDQARKRPNAGTANRGPEGRDEQWLERKVREMYQDVLNEPVPEDLLNILQRIPKLGD